MRFFIFVSLFLTYISLFGAKIIIIADEQPKDNSGKVTEKVTENKKNTKTEKKNSVKDLKAQFENDSDLKKTKEKEEKTERNKKHFISPFIEKGTRVFTHAGVTKHNFDKTGINLGTSYLYYLGDDLFIGGELDINIFKLKQGEFNNLYDYSTIGPIAYFEISSDKTSAFDVFVGGGLFVLGIIDWDDYWFAPYGGIAWFKNKIFLKAKYTFLGIESGKNDYMVGFQFGFFMDFRPKRLNQGYYNDEL